MTIVNEFIRANHLAPLRFGVLDCSISAGTCTLVAKALNQSGIAVVLFRTTDNAVRIRDIVDSMGQEPDHVILEETRPETLLDIAEQALLFIGAEGPLTERMAARKIPILRIENLNGDAPEAGIIEQLRPFLLRREEKGAGR
jgi:hypothetical protein